MKTRFLFVAAVVLPLLNGCANANSETEKVATNIVVQPAQAAPPADAPAAAKPTPEAEVPAGEPVNITAPPPASIKLSPAAAEITKLVQAGVDPGVILTYVTNSPNTYRLEADEIVYLKDIGMSPDLVTAMIQHDQKIREASLNGATVTSPSTPAVSVWTAGLVAPSSNVWQQEVTEPAPAAQPSTTTTVPPPPAEETPSPETVNYFYDSLAPYGTWIDVEGYGRCWRPTVVVTTPGWRPYSHGGRWAWTDSGWYWYSDYSWGWAPFHYGRWYSHPRWGWCWVPGSVWGPSWVSWRYSDSYCGWAPLPPAAYYSPRVGFTYFGSSCGSSFSFGLTWDCFTFVSYHNFHSRRYDRDCVPHHQAGQVFNNTTVVNNIIRGNNNTIINQGIAPTRITAASGAPVRQVTIRDGRGPRDGRGTRQEQIAQDGSTLNVVRHTVPTGRGHAIVGGNSSGGRGGARGLTTGNATVNAPAAPAQASSQSGLVPPRGGGPRHTVPTRNEASTPSAPAAPAAPLVQSSPAAAPAVSAPTSSQSGLVPPRGGGSRHTVPTRNESSTVSAPTAPVPTQTGGSAPAAASAGTRNEAGTGALIIRTPRTPRAQNNNPVAVGNAATQPQPAATPAPASGSTGSPSTPPPRTVRQQGTPWLNNTPAPAQSPNLAGQSETVRQWQTQPGGGTRNNGPRQTAPSHAAPSAPQAAPAYQATAPTRVFGAPAQPQPMQSYSPPTRSTPAPQAPSSQPSYSPPPRQSAPSYSPPPRQSAPSYSPPPSRSEPSSSRSSSRSESRSESRGSSSSGSSRSNDDRPSRGR